MIRVVHLAKS